MKIKIVKLKCKRCEHRWYPTQREIRICPKCKSVYWNKLKHKKGDAN